MARPEYDSAYVNSVIGEGTSFTGDLKGKGLLRIDGDFEGIVHVEGKVLLGHGGRARCNIHADDVVVGGILKGDVFARRKARVLASAMVIGNIYAPELSVEEGVFLNGVCKITGTEEELEKQKKIRAGESSVFTLEWKEDQAKTDPSPGLKQD